MSNLSGKKLIVTGAASGMGLTTAGVLAARGASVVLGDIQADAVKAAALELRNKGLAAVGVPCDISQEDQVHNMIDVCVSEFGGITGLHNNAALLEADIMARRDASIADIDAELFARIVRVNLIGCALVVKHAIPHIVKAGGGSIVNTASTAGILAEHVRPMYGASKAAVIGFTRNIATQYGKQGVRCVSISPGVILTPALKANISKEEVSRLIKHGLLARAGETQDIAHLVAFLLSDEAAFITGIDIPVDGGMTAHFPTFADEMDAKARTKS